jgi:hypothetical protein
MSSASSASVASSALVRRMKPPVFCPAGRGGASAVHAARSCSRSSALPIFWLMPMWLSCGRNTSMRPAMLTCVDSRAPLVPMASLITCTVSVWPSNTWRSMGGSGRRAALAAGVQVGHVQEGGALQADVDEGALHARQHAHHLAQVDVAHQAALERALDVQLLHRAVLDDGHARFLRGPVDEEDVLHAMALSPAPDPGLQRQRTPARAAAAWSQTAAGP